MALHRQALGESLLLGVPQENARYRPLFLCEAEDRANEVLIDPVPRDQRPQWAATSGYGTTTAERPLEDALTAIKTRRAVREYLPTEIPREWIEKLLDDERISF